MSIFGIILFAIIGFKIHAGVIYWVAYGMGVLLSDFFLDIMEDLL